jgi:hypothetical protein
VRSIFILRTRIAQSYDYLHLFVIE